jgi:plastocyanin
MRTRIQHGGLLLVALAAAVAVLALAACGNSTSTPTSSATPATTPAANGATVTIKDFAFAPRTLTVPVGATVTWTNSDSAAHTVTSADGMATDAATTDLFDSGLMGDGDTFTHTFDTAGTYYYLCTPHRSMASMHAEVVVE